MKQRIVVISLALGTLGALGATRPVKVSVDV